MGIWSCLGTDLDTVRDALYNGKSGIGLQKERLDYGYRSGLTGIVPEPEITTVSRRLLFPPSSEDIFSLV